MAETVFHILLLKLKENNEKENNFLSDALF